MKKAEAIQLLGGTVSAVAKATGITYQAVRQWPEELPQRIEDRVIAAQVRLGVKRKRRKDAPAVSKAVA